MLRLITRLLRSDSGATAIEYGLIAALIAVVIIGGVQHIGVNAGLAFQAVAGAM
jgi:pilus assembly protein Flp/PilA